MPTGRHAALAPLLPLIVGRNNAEREELLGHQTVALGVEVIEETLGFTTTGECLLNKGDLSDADKECRARGTLQRLFLVRHAVARELRFVSG